MEFGTPPTGAQLTSPASSGAASAPARAPEAPLAGSKAIAAHPAITSAPQRGRQSQEPELDQASISGATLEPEESHFPAFGQDAEEEVSGGGGSKKILFAAVLLLGAAAAAYVGWNRMEATHPQPAAPPLLPAQPATVVPPPEPAAVAGESQPQDNQITAAPGDASELVVTPSSSKPTAALPTGAAGGKASALPKTGSEANEISAIPAPPAAPAESSPPLVVSKGASVRPKSEAETSEPESAPSPTTIATATDSRALSGLVNTNAAAVAHSAQQPRKISQGVSQGLLIKKIQPTYSPQARQLRLEGKVELQANISKTGNITEVKQVSGDPILGRSAMDAVKQWKYKPYFLNGEPIEIQTQITVNFKLP
jgi:protein TonB